MKLNIGKFAEKKQFTTEEVCFIGKHFIGKHIIPENILTDMLKVCEEMECDVLDIFNNRSLYCIKNLEWEFLSDKCLLVLMNDGTMKVWSYGYFDICPTDVLFSSEKECDEICEHRNEVFKVMIQGIHNDIDCGIFDDMLDK